jgi:hypothetical protein
MLFRGTLRKEKLLPWKEARKTLLQESKPQRTTFSKIRDQEQRGYLILEV